MLTVEIMVVDDDVSVVEMYAAMLQTIGVNHVTKYTDPNDALEYLSNCHVMPDIVISDFNMPGLNGHDLIQIVRSNNRAAKSVKFIMISGYDIDATQLNDIEFFMKPINLMQFRSYIRNYIGTLSREPLCI